MSLHDFVGLIARWFHILSAIALVGSLLFAKHVLIPSGHVSLIARFGNILRFAGVLLLVSGLRNFLAKSAYPPPYHAVFGLKFLLALHVIAVGWMLANPNTPDSKKSRQVTGAAISAVIVVLLSGYLRALSL
jgi:hypothetical protein